MQSNDQIKEKFWQEHISNWKRSSLGIRDYCQRHEISKDSFYYWRKRMSSSQGKNEKSSREPSTFVPVMIEKSPISSSMSSVYLEDPKWLGAFAATLIRGLQ